MNYAAECAIKCGEPLFRAFLRSRPRVMALSTVPGNPWVFVRSKEDAAIAVRFLVDIDSRRELNTDNEAAMRWRELAADFDLWQRDI